MLPSQLRVNAISPVEAFRGRKIDAKRDLRVTFGEYAQVVSPPPITGHNSMQPRSEGAIALLPLGNTTGSVKFFALASKSYVTRHLWRTVPMPEHEVALMNKIASVPTNIDARETQPVGDRVTVGGRAIESAPTRNVEPALSNDVGILPSHEREEDEIAPNVESGERQERDDSQNPNLNLEMQRMGGESSAWNTRHGGDVMSQREEAGARGPPESEPRTVTEVHGYSLRPSRSKGCPPPLVGVSCSDTLNHELVLHVSVAEALKQHGDAAKRVIQEELTQMVALQVWDYPSAKNFSGHKVLPSFIFLKEKHTPTGAFDRLKARLVAGGHRQNRDLYDSDAISAPTASLTSAMIVIALAAAEKRKVAVVDITGAFLNAQIERDVFVRLAPLVSAQFVSVDPRAAVHSASDGSLVVKLKKALYGCLERAKLWFRHNFSACRWMCCTSFPTVLLSQAALLLDQDQ